MNIIATLQTQGTYLCHTCGLFSLQDLATASQQRLGTVTCEVLRGRPLSLFFHRQFTCRQGIKTLATHHSWIFNGFVWVCWYVCVHVSVRASGNVWTAASTALVAGGYLSTGMNATCDWGCILTGLCKAKDKDGYTWFRAVLDNRWSFTIRLSNSGPGAITQYGLCAPTGFWLLLKCLFNVLFKQYLKESMQVGNIWNLTKFCRFYKQMYPPQTNTIFNHRLC